MDSTDKHLRGQVERNLAAMKEANRAIVKGYLDELEARGVRPATLSNYAPSLRHFEQQACPDFKAGVTKAQARAFSRWLEAHYPKPGSRKLHADNVLWFLRFEDEDGSTLIPVERGATKHLEDFRETQRKNVVPREDLVPVTAEEVLEAVRLAEGHRDKALFSVAFETGWRKSELYHMSRGGVRFYSKDGIEMAEVRTPKGKTGFKRAIIVNSVPYLRSLLDDHPDRDAAAPLWIADRRKYSPKDREAGRLSRRGIYGIIVRLTEAATKRHGWPHLLRHSRVSQLSVSLPEGSWAPWWA